MHSRSRHCASGPCQLPRRPRTCCSLLVRAHTSALLLSSHDDEGDLGSGPLAHTDADGQAQHWHITSGKLLHTIDPASKGNQLYGTVSRCGRAAPSHCSRLPPPHRSYCVDYNPDGSQFATAGKDLTVCMSLAVVPIMCTGLALVMTVCLNLQIRLYDEATKSLVTELSGG